MHSFALLSAIVPLLPAGPAAHNEPAAHRYSIQATLQTIEEHRRLDVVEPEENMFMMDAPGLTLTFGITFPEGRTLLEIEQPEEVAAADSEGTDLSAIEPDFMGDLTYVEVQQIWGEQPASFDFSLALPKRSAATFDLNAELTVTTYGSLETIDAPLTSEWSELDAANFGGTAASARLTVEDGAPQVEIRPGTVRNRIEEVQLVSGGQTLESGMSMWSDQTLTYMFEGQPADAMTLKLTLRKGLEQTTITINLDDQDLP